MFKKTLLCFDSIRDKVYYIKQTRKAILSPARQIVSKALITIPAKDIQNQYKQI